jgi:ferric-dicitrate binding protein FerR (iron transport regulator)
VKREGTRSSAALAALGLEAPLSRASQLRVDEWTVRRMWETIQGRSSAAARRAKGRARARSWSFGLALGLLLASWVALTWLPRARGFQGPLVTSEGKRFESVEAPVAGSATRVELADGSQIEAAPGARVEGLAATASEFVLLLRRGRAHFSVTPGGPRRWLIETRGASVEVVGTRFSVESGAGFVAVRVEAGVVLLRSPLLADGVQRIGAGQALRLDTGSAAEERESAVGAAAPAAPAAGADQERTDDARTPDGHGAADTVEDAVVNSGRAPALAGRAARHTHRTAGELWAGADRARRAGDAAHAAELLERLLEEHPGDSQAALGAYTLGVLQLEQLARPRAAARRFRQALELGIAAGLRESCYVRWAEALGQTGDARELRRVARQYLRGYPLGEQRDTMQKLLEQHTPSENEGPSSGESQK